MLAWCAGRSCDGFCTFSLGNTSTALLPDYPQYRVYSSRNPLLRFFVLLPAGISGEQLMTDFFNASGLHWHKEPPQVFDWGGSFLLSIRVKPEVKETEPGSSGRHTFLAPDKKAVETLLLHYSPTTSPVNARRLPWRYGRKPKRCQQWQRRVRTGVWRQACSCREFPRVRECDRSQSSTWQCDGDAYADHNLFQIISSLFIQQRR